MNIGITRFGGRSDIDLPMYLNMLLHVMIGVVGKELEKTEICRLMKGEICGMLVSGMASDHIWVYNLHSVLVQDVVA